jgi:hypothetical protein
MVEVKEAFSQFEDFKKKELEQQNHVKSIS